MSNVEVMEPRPVLEVVGNLLNGKFNLDGVKDPDVLAYLSSIAEIKLGEAINSIAQGNPATEDLEDEMIANAIEIRDTLEEKGIPFTENNECCETKIEEEDIIRYGTFEDVANAQGERYPNNQEDYVDMMYNVADL